MFQSTLDTIEANQLVIGNLQEQVQRGQNECEEVENEHAHRRAEIDEEARKERVRKGEIKAKRDTIQYEIVCISDDYKSTFDKKLKMHEDMREINETIEVINEEISGRDEEILKLRIKMR